MKTAEDVYNFWFVSHGKDDWFGGKPEFDAELAAEFGDAVPRVALGEAFGWRKTPKGRLAEIIVLDQFSRQLYRETAKAFAQDGMALALAQEAVAGGHDQALDASGRMFLYMPYMHSESLLVHDEALRLFGSLDMPDILEFESKHHALIKRFGRYPKRNAALGRRSTPEEIAYIEEAGDSMF